MNPRKLRRSSRILSISHWDFDGVSCSIALSNYFKNIKCISCTFTNVDNIIERTNIDDYAAIFITDCFPKQAETFDLTDKIIVLDHHPGSQKLHNPSKNLYSVLDNCGAVLTKNWIESTYNFDLSHINNLLKYTNDYDLWIHRFPKSKMINELFWKYGDTKFRQRFMDGNTRFTNWELSFIRKRINEFKETFKKLEIFEFNKIKGCLIVVNNFINDLAHKLLKEEGYEIVLVQNARNKHISVRIESDDVDIGKILDELNVGGGHKKAGGFNVKHTTIDALKNDIKKIEDYCYERYESWRK